jgi:hypothetical protein
MNTKSAGASAFVLSKMYFSQHITEENVMHYVD